jgi:hypothetical protein
VRAYWRRVEAVLPRIPSPTSQYRQFEGRLSLSGTVLSGDAIAGVRDDRATGNRTYYVRGSVSLDAGELAHGSGGGQVAVTVDRHGRPVDLALMGSGELNRSRDLPVALQPVAGHLTAGRGRTWELEGHLDLTQPGRPSVSSLLSDPRRLMRLVMDDGFVQMRSYGVSNTSVGADGRVKAGIGFGAGFTHTNASQRLLNALDHTREGFWVPRYDCLTAASA